jgi:hypothetical protein
MVAVRKRTSDDANFIVFIPVHKHRSLASILTLELAEKGANTMDVLPTV